MKEFNSIVDYIKDQADRYDANNLQFEQDILFKIRKETDKYMDMIVNTVVVDITSVLIMQKLMISIQTIMDKYVLQCKKILLDTFSKYSDTAYKYTDDLIELGTTIEQKFNSDIKEQKSNKEYDEDTLDFIQNHSFELLKGHSQTKIEQIRSKLGDLFLKGKANKATVRAEIQRILGVNKSKAEEIAQTELSMAYNHGVLKRLKDYENLTGKKPKKYWHGFKYSASTCEYCRPRIGSVYDIDDDTESLPAHPRCRCIWLPILDGWDSPVNTSLISRANMLNTGYNKEMMYQRINTRLGINYASYMNEDAMSDYLSGERTPKIEKELNIARDRYISDMIDSFDIAKDLSRSHMSNEFNTQMNFWKKYVAGAMADNNIALLDNCYEAIKGVVVLPWNAEQLDKWNRLLNIIEKF